MTHRPGSPVRSPARRPSLLGLLRLALGIACVAGFGLAQHDRAPAVADDQGGFTNFETEPVRPIALGPDARRLYALNTAEDHLEIFDVSGPAALRLGEVAVGLRPVALAVRSDDEVWVSNHLSDSVSVVDTSDPTAPRVVRTFDVGDEPRDIVVGGPNGDRVFVATARRADFDVPGAGRADVWVFDAARPQAPPAVVTLAGLPARALAASADGRTVFAAIFHSGNKTTVVDEAKVAAGGGPPPPSPANTSGAEPPATGLIVAYQSGQWRDEANRDWTASLPFTLPDDDVFAIDAGADPPRVVNRIQGVGTTLFNMAVRPGTGELWVTNTEAHNAVRFEPNLRGQAADSRVTTVFGPLDAAASSLAVQLNPHIDRSRSPGPATEIARSLGQPTAIVFSRDGAAAYVAAFGSAKVGELDATGRVVRRIDVGFGPGGLALDDDRARLYVLNHLDATISVVDLAAGRSIATVPLHFDPTPPEVHAGRPLLYDMTIAGGHGDMSCATCHVFADMDHLAWDLGDPTGTIIRMPFALTHENFIFKPRDFKYHPMKGPMTTQSFRGMAGAGPMHWRADRFGGAGEEDDELESFSQFMPAFQTLNGLAAPLPRDDMDKLARFLFTIRYPPNPVQAIDRSRTPEQEAGFEIFTGPGKVDSGIDNCAGCHTLPIGTNKRINFEGARTGQDFKAPHLRNLYQKLGRFDVDGPQVSGFGFAHDGSADTLVHFLESDVFDFPGETAEEKDARRKEAAAFVLAFDTGMAPAVGRQVTLGAGPPDAERLARLDVLAARATAGDCDLVARGRRSGEARGWLWQGGRFQPDRRAEAPEALSAVVAGASARGAETTFTCVPPGDGVRGALDRDRDGAWNRDELEAGTDPADPASRPAPSTPETPSASPTATPTATPVPASATPTATEAARPPAAVFLPLVRLDPPG